ncbi:MAG: LptF/LptG family permease [Prevotella sp.]|nr:LptF/LptG family permease [Prevotella sp.]
MNYRKIRRWHRFYKLRRTLERRFSGVIRAFRWLRGKFSWLAPVLAWIGHKLRWLNPRRYVKTIDWYIIKKFLTTYFFAIALIISISIVFDVNENLSKFTEYHAPLKAIVFDYYLNFIPYFSNLFSPLFVFIAVIFFTSKMAGNSEIISILAAGISFKRMMRPYMISAALISLLTFYLGSYVIPKGTVIKQNFETLYKNKKRNNAAENVQLQVGKGIIAYIQHYDNNLKRGYGFSLDKFENKKLVNHMTASEIQYDTISNSKFHWKATSWRIRDMKGLKEKITSGNAIDTLILMEPTDLVFSKGQQETFTSPQLREYIDRQIDRGSTNVVQYEVEYHKRIASSFASFILTTIGVSLSSRKRKGGMGLYLGIGLALSFGYIMLQTVSATFAINAGTPAMLAAWIPNIIFAVVAWFCYRQAPR